MNNSAFRKLVRTDKGTVLRKFALIASTCVALLAAPAHAQQIDIAAGGSILLASTPPSSSVNFQQPPEKGGVYLSVSGDYVRFKHRLGLNLETAWRYHQGTYPYNGEAYRPVFSDVNVLFQPRLTKKFGLDLMAGLGVASNRFYGPYAGSCGPGCIIYTSSNHFMEDLSGGVRYYVWHRLPNVFVRPEIHYYHIQNNREFRSNNVFRAGASLGYTFGQH